MLNHYKKWLFCLMCIFVIIAQVMGKNPVRIKDIAIIKGLRDNQLSGFGLVIGLQGNGDGKAFTLTKKMLANLAVNHGYAITSDDISSKNIAAVLVTANIGPFTRAGDRVDITVSSIGDSKSLKGGVLLQTPLKAADGTVYAVAQGRLIAGEKDTGSETSATLPDGAIIERQIVANYLSDNKLEIILKYPDFVTASQVKEAILTINPELTVTAVDAGLIEVELGETELQSPVDFIAQMEVLTITPDYVSAVVINKKTGVIVIGEDVLIQECSVSTPFAQVNVGRNVKTKKNNVKIANQTIGELIEILNESGLNTDEIISLIESIHKIGAINAKIIVM